MDEKEFVVSVNIHKYINAKDRDEAIQKFADDNFPEIDIDVLLPYIDCGEMED